MSQHRPNTVKSNGIHRNGRTRMRASSTLANSPDPPHTDNTTP